MHHSAYLLWLPLGTALIGALAALAGNAISPIFGARKAHEQWLRDKRAERFEEHYRFIDRAMEVVRYDKLVVTDKNPPDDLLPGLFDSAALLEMYATPAMGQASIEAATAYSMWEMNRTLQRVPDSDPEDLVQYTDDFMAKAEKVKAMIRAELKVE